MLSDERATKSLRWFMSKVRKEDKDKGEAFEVDGHLAHAFADLRRRCSGSSCEMVVRMLGNLEDHTRLRRRPASFANEIVCLEPGLGAHDQVFKPSTQNVAGHGACFCR